MFGIANQEKQVQYFIPAIDRVEFIERVSKVESDRRTRVHKHAITATGQEEWDRFVHEAGLGTHCIPDIGSYPRQLSSVPFCPFYLCPLLSNRVNDSPQPKILSSGKSWKLAAVLMSAPQVSGTVNKRKRDRLGKGVGVAQAHCSSQQLISGIVNFDGPGILGNFNSPVVSVKGDSIVFVFGLPGTIPERCPCQHQ
jgi:hypothetical protein